MEPDGRDHKSHVLSILPPENDDPADQLSAAGFVHQRDQAVSEFHLNGLHSQQGVDIVDVLVVVRLAAAWSSGTASPALALSASSICLARHFVIAPVSATERTAPTNRRAGSESLEKAQHQKDHAGRIIALAGP